MQLPGGLLLDGKILRDVEFAELNGKFEMLLAEQIAQATRHVEKVTQALSIAVQRIGDQAANPQLVAQLCVGDRQYLMCELSARLHQHPVWLNAGCQSCQDTFDVSFRYQQLPVKAAASGYPQTSLNTALGQVSVRVPNGQDQADIADLTDNQESLIRLLRRIVRRAGDNAEIDPALFNSADIQAIEQSVEAIAPEMASELLCHCPHCDSENRVALDLYRCLQHKADHLLHDIHQIARHYHWSEEAILALPRQRRQAYLNLIDQSRGMRNQAGVTSMEFSH